MDDFLGSLVGIIYGFYPSLGLSYFLIWSEK
jgi:hypothetical protein